MTREEVQAGLDALNNAVNTGRVTQETLDLADKLLPQEVFSEDARRDVLAELQQMMGGDGGVL